MAKYITLDGLSAFLNKLKDGSYRATNEEFGAIKYDNKTLFAGDNAKDPNSIDDDYTYHPLQIGKDHEWKNDGDNLSNLNNFVEYGIYNLYGERTRSNDNLPIMNTGGGHTFQGRLLVYDSSLPNTGNAGNDCCITQVLTLSNRVGGDGNTYIRTGVGRTKSTLTWGTWGKLQTNVEVGQISETNLANLIDNGMYSGVISYGSGSSLTTSLDPAITFVLITVNGYAAASQVGATPRCTQLLYGISVNGKVVVKKRIGEKSGDNFYFGLWGDLSGVPAATSTSVGGIKVASVRSTSPSLIYGSTTDNRSYGIELDSNGKAFVNVPWTGTKYTFGTGVICNDSFVQANVDNTTIFAGDHTKGNGGVTSGGLNPIQLGQDWEWKNTGDSLSNVNDFVEYGIYNLYGERTRIDDNLPIQNTGGGHTFRARLLVYDSSLPDVGLDQKDCCITQVLTLSNRVGGDGNTYIRTASGSSKNSLTWGTWGKMQTNVEVGAIYSWDLDKCVDNGMYSGAVTVFDSSIVPDGSGLMYIFNNSPYVYSKRELIGLNSSSYYALIYRNPLVAANSFNSTIVLRDGHTQYGDYGYLCNGLSFEDGIYDLIDPKTITIDLYPSSVNHGSKIAPYYSSNFGVNFSPGIPYNTITFALITVNNYAVASQVGTDQMVTQLLYGIDVSGTFVLRKRIGTKTNDTWSFNVWEEIGGQIQAASNTTLGGIKVANVRSTAPAITQGGTTSNRYYGVELDKNGKAFVNVPWTDNIALMTTTNESNSFSGVLVTYRLTELTNTALTEVKITGFFSPAAERVSEYGIMFNATSNTKFAWPDSSTSYVVKWANGVQPCENGTKIGAGLWKILFTYTPGLKVYTATFSKYS